MASPDSVLDLLRKIRDALAQVRKGLKAQHVEESDPANAPIFKPLRAAEQAVAAASRRLDGGLVVTDAEMAAIEQLFTDIKTGVV